MKKQIGLTVALSLGLLTANVALANDALLGALLGGGAGVLVGQSVGGRDGALIGGALGAAAGALIAADQRESRRDHRGEYYSPPAYYAQPAYRPQQTYYLNRPSSERSVVYYANDRHERRYDGHRDRRDPRDHRRDGIARPW